MNPIVHNHTAIVKQSALDLGFQFCGVSKAGFLEEEAPKLETWLQKGMHGNMHYMNNHFDKRLDPTLLVEGAKSVVTLLYNYAPEVDVFADKKHKISKYAYGQDYHWVIKDKLQNYLKTLQDKIGQVEGRFFVDSAPVMERAWAKKSGLGWIGKHSLLINKGHGSFFFIAVLISDLELVADGPVKDFCGTCTKCMDACPTDAIPLPYTVDGSKCISYLTIELKDAIPNEFKGKMESWAFGCDICQDVCPWNRFSKPHKEPQFEPSEEMKALDSEHWESLTQEMFSKIFKGSPIKRTKFSGIKRNIEFLKRS